MVRQRKVRFIEPGGRPGRPFNAWIGRWPLLGPIILATILHERGYDVAVYNENVSGPITDNPEAYADFCAADVVGISIMTPTANRGYQIAGRIRRDAPQVRIVFGGVHATFLPQEAIRHGDIVVAGEGESVIEAIARGEIASGIVHAPPLADLDAIPPLNHELMRDFQVLLSRCRRRELYQLPLVTSRGCPHGCTFCSVTRMFGRKVRRQSPAKVYQDICGYVRRGFRHLFFYDDNFTSDRGWARALLERIAPLAVRFNAQVRADFPWTDAHRRQPDEDLLAAMRRAGCDVLYVGYETVDDSTADEWGKGYRGGNGLRLRQRLEQDTRILHDNGFWIHGMFVLGPGHGRQDAADILHFARRNKLETLQVSILTPLPGTPLFGQMRPHLLFTDFPQDWDYYDGGHCLYDHARLGLEGTQEVVLDVHRRFYGWGGWSWPRVRAFIRERLPLQDKLAMVWSNAGAARRVLRQWQEETKAFLTLARERASRRPGRQPAS